MVWWSMASPPHDLPLLLTRAARAQRSLTAARLADLGLYPGQDDLLRCLWRKDGQTQVELVSQLGVESPTVTKMVGRLETAGFVRRRRHPADRRATQVWLTPAGRALRPHVQRLRSASTRELVAPLTERQQATLVNLLERIVAASDDT